MIDDPEILYDVKGKLGVITLSRLKALNALNHFMCISLHKKLDAWKGDPKIEAVIIMGKGAKAFCAGGDVIALYNAGKDWKEGQGKIGSWRDFFKHEYRLNAAIHHFPKPYIAIMDGITMGGGVGISVHGSHRVATENTVFAMPETGLGLFPDVGGGHFMSRLTGHTGMYLGLLGERIKAPDCCALGITDTYMESRDIDNLIEILAKTPKLDNDTVSNVIGRFYKEPGLSPMMEKLDDINEIFSLASVIDILRALKKNGSDWALNLYRSLMKKSPTSLKVTFHQIRKGALLTFDQNMVMEYKVVNRLMKGNDFYEGVRAILIDKDYTPVWRPSKLANVTPEAMQVHFATMEELNLTIDKDNHAFIDD